MRNRLQSFFRLDTQFDEVFWAILILVLLYVVQLVTDGSIHL